MPKSFFGSVAGSLLSRGGVVLPPGPGLGDVPEQAAPAGDPHFDDVPLLLRMENSSNFTVNSGYVGGNMSMEGNSGFDATEYPFPEAGSVGRTGSGATSYGTLAHHADYTGFTGEFTIEAWFRRDSEANAQQGIFSKYSATSNQRGWAIIMQDPETFRFLLSTNGSSLQSFSSSSFDTRWLWFHVAIVRDGANIVSLFVNGARLGEITVSGTIFNNTSAPVVVGGYNNGAAQLGNRVTNCRITRGVARYTNNFDPVLWPFPAQQPPAFVPVALGKLQLTQYDELLSPQYLNLSGGETGKLKLTGDG